MAHVHILAGAGTLQRRLLERTIEDARKKGYDEVRRTEGADWRALLTENRGGGLFEEKVLIVLGDADKMGQIPAALSGLLEKPGAGTIILTPCASETTVASKELLPFCSVSKATQPSPWSKERDEAIQKAAEKHGVSIMRDAVSLIKEFFDDMGEAEAEAEKLAAASLARGRRKIETSDVELLCLSDDSRVMLKLLDGICNGKALESIAALEALRRNAELLPTLSALHNRVRLALYTAAFPKEKSAFSRALGARDYAQRQAENAARLYGREKLVALVMGLVRINSNEKTGQGASWRDLDMLIIDLLSEQK